jgi:hypothetical protein
MNKFTKIRRRIGIVLFLVVLFLILSLVYIFQNLNIFYITTPPSTLSVLNLQEGVLSIDGTEDLTLNIFDSYIKESGNEEIKIINNDQIVKEVKLDNSQGSLLTIYVNAAQSYCFFSADVTSVYYKSDTNTQELVTVNLNSEGNFIQIALNHRENIYLYPSKYSADKLPNVLAGRRIIGIYPIDCTMLDNAEIKFNTIMLFKNFNSEEQRNFYFEEIKRIQSS